LKQAYNKERYEKVVLLKNTYSVITIYCIYFVFPYPHLRDTTHHSQLMQNPDMATRDI